jgi:hypothetical protein
MFGAALTAERWMQRQPKLRAKDFVLEIGGRAILAFRAGSRRAALGFCAEEWFLSELASYRSGGCQLWSGQRDFTIRRARAAEAALLQIALTTEIARGEYEGDIFAFLVPVDALVQ